MIPDSKSAIFSLKEIDLQSVAGCFIIVFDGIGVHAGRGGLLRMPGDYTIHYYIAYTSLNGSASPDK